MNGAAFDTRAAVKALREAGTGERLAEAVTAVVRHAASARIAARWRRKPICMPRKPISKPI